MIAHAVTIEAHSPANAGTWGWRETFAGEASAAAQGRPADGVGETGRTDLPCATIEDVRLTMEAILTANDETKVAEIALRMSALALSQELSIQTLTLNDLLQALLKSKALSPNEAAVALTKTADRLSLKLAEKRNPLMEVMNAPVERYVSDLLSTAEALQFGGAKDG